MERRTVSMERSTVVFLATALVAVALGMGALLGREAMPGRVTVTEAPRQPPGPWPAWHATMGRFDLALQRQDRAAALREWQAAYAVALAARHWQPIVETGDAALRVAALDTLRAPYASKAREAYMAALSRARAARSAEGLRRVAESFARLGDDEAAAAVRRLSERLPVVSHR